MIAPFIGKLQDQHRSHGYRDRVDMMRDGGLQAQTHPSQPALSASRPQQRPVRKEVHPVISKPTMAFLLQLQRFVDEKSSSLQCNFFSLQPQVNPIDKYAPPDYLTIMYQYHPTPTPEDLGLISYLDSPPSSTRAV